MQSERPQKKFSARTQEKDVLASLPRTGWVHRTGYGRCGITLSIVPISLHFEDAIEVHSYFRCTLLCITHDTDCG